MSQSLCNHAIIAILESVYFISKAVIRVEKIQKFLAYLERERRAGEVRRTHTLRTITLEMHACALHLVSVQVLLVWIHLAFVELFYQFSCHKRIEFVHVNDDGNLVDALVSHVGKLVNAHHLHANIFAGRVLFLVFQFDIERTSLHKHTSPLPPILKESQFASACIVLYGDYAVRCTTLREALFESCNDASYGDSIQLAQFFLVGILSEIQTITVAHRLEHHGIVVQWAER